MDLLGDSRLWSVDLLLQYRLRLVGGRLCWSSSWLGASIFSVTSLYTSGSSISVLDANSGGVDSRRVPVEAICIMSSNSVLQILLQAFHPITLTI